ncbi:MAG: hypothetical protein ACK4MQ_10850 [Hyphomonas sp.]
MMRFISILLLLAGLLAAGIGGAALLEQYRPATAPVADFAEAPPELPATGPGTEEDRFPEIAAAAPDEFEALAPPPSAPAEVTGESEELAGIASVGDDDFNFQPMLEEAPPAAMSRAAPPAPVDIDDPGVTTAVSPSFIDSLKTVPVAHETPASAEYKRPFNVTFAIDATGDTTAADALPGRGVIREDQARVSDRVEVRLSGASFTITPTSPPVQSLSPLTENTWRWSVTPLTAGDHDLTFEIFAIDSDEVVPLRTFRDTVTVRVSGINRAIAFADQANPLFVLLGGLGSILAGIFGVARFFVKK